MTTVVLADDQEMVRIGFAMILGAAPDIDVVAQASDGVEAVSVIAETRPDVALLDIRMPRIDGIEVCRRITEGGTRAVMVTTFGEPDYVDAALAAGASGFLLKDAGPDLLLAAVRAAATGDALISPALTVDLLARNRRQGRGDAAAAEAIGELTAREREVARCVARGRTNAEIADELVISLGTVKTHLGAITRRLGARNRVEIAAAVWASGEMD
ncbi:response regulator transcription factor [Tsukamurella sp. 1534]|uniref:response regulator n=1 Tax=Tsukamurella sp. 1534 TaxID=1151061 RepID=UPI0002F7D339|nr:response regulator transcription factor [Tsukamurella sp. 1534]